MARNLFPATDSDRTAYVRSGSDLVAAAAGTVVDVYLDQARTQPADVQHVGGAAVTSGNPLRVDADSRWPRFLGPNDDRKRLWVSIASGTPVEAVADLQAQVETLTTDLAGKQSLDPDLTAIAALAPADGDVVQRTGGAWANRTTSQLKTSLSLVKADVGLGAVDNTSDAGKPVSTAQQAALDGKASTTHASTHASAGSDPVTPGAIGAAASGHTHSGTYSPVGHGHNESDVTGLVTDLAGKLAASANLSDLASASTARTNLGLGAAATSPLADAAPPAVAASGAVGVSTDVAREDHTHAGASTDHSASHEPGGSDPMTVDAAANVGSLRSLGTGAQQAAAGNAAPNAHAGSHASGQSDAVTPAAIGAVPTTRTITAGTGLTGGGDLSANRTLAADVQTVAGRTGAVSLTETDVPWTVVPRTTAYTAVSGDLVLCDATSGAFAVTLPAATAGRKVIVKKVDASLNAVTVTGTVDGVVNPTLTVQHAALEMVADGTGWYQVSTSGGTTTEIRDYTATQSGITTPTGILGAYVTLIQGGGGGGSGRRGAASTDRGGGGGGGCGGVIHEVWVPASTWAGTYSVTVGAGGTAGAAVTADDTNGSNGGAGGQSSLNTGSFALSTTGNNGGTGGTTTGGTAGSGGFPLNVSGGAGGTGAGTGGGGGQSSGAVSGSGGGGGGGVSSANAAGAGGAGGGNYGTSGATGGVVGGASPTVGASRAAGLGGLGGGGGAGAVSGAAQAGAAGGTYGGPGGGGGASVNGSASGAGGAGAPGFARVQFIYPGIGSGGPGAVPLATVTTRGDLLAATGGAALTRLGAGTDGQVIKALASQAMGLAYGDAANVQTFTSSGTWTKPAGCTSVTVFLLGGGSGGGSGRRGAAGTIRAGGGSGAGSSLSVATFPAALLSSTETVVVGAGGAGGAAVTADNTDGAAGGTGGISTFKADTFIRAGAGAGGGGGTATGGAAGGSSANGVFAGSTGVASSSTGTAGNNGLFPAFGGPSGGSGGGVTSGDAVSAGGTGARANASQVAAPAGGTAPGGAGGPGVSVASGLPFPGTSGGGGGSSITGAGGTGGAGGNYGAGGGGGGASLNGNNSGAGGAGAPGIVVVISV